MLTSSFAAVGYSHKEPGKLITETSWTDANDKNLSAYLRSKTLAEKAAWDFIASQANANAGSANLRAMVNPKANGQRFLALAGEIMWLPGIALLLKNKMGDKGQKITTKTLPDWLVRVVALFNLRG